YELLPNVVPHAGSALQEPPPSQVSRPRKLLKEIGPNFRLARWGASLEDVQRTEPVLPRLVKPDRLEYDRAFAGKACRVEYVFFDKHLVSGRYVFQTEELMPDASISAYIELKDSLCESYGLPMQRQGAQVNQTWLDETYRRDPGNWGLAVSLGHLILQSAWLL